MADGCVDQYVRVARIDEIDHEQHHNGKRAQDPASQPPLRGMRPDLALDAQALANHGCRPVQNFGQVSARLLLHQDARHQHLEVLRGHMVQHLVQGIA